MNGIPKILKEKLSINYKKIFVEIIPIKKDDIYNNVLYAENFVAITVSVPDNTLQFQKEEAANEITSLLTDFKEIHKRDIIVRFEDIKKENIFWEY